VAGPRLSRGRCEQQRGDCATPMTFDGAWPDAIGKLHDGRRHRDAVIEITSPGEGASAAIGMQRPRGES